MRSSHRADLTGTSVFSMEAHLLSLYPSIPLSLSDPDKVVASITKYLLYKAIHIKKKKPKNIKVLTLLLGLRVSNNNSLPGKISYFPQVWFLKWHFGASAF